LLSKISLILLALFFFSCGSQFGEERSDSPGAPGMEKPRPQGAQGWVNGQEWRIQSGRARIHFHSSEKYLVVDLWNQVFEHPCTEKVGSPLQVHFKTLPETGAWELGKDSFKNEPFIAFSDLNLMSITRNLIANSGFIAIDQIGSEVEGRFMAFFNSADFPRTEATGAFTVPLCE
jgi:hypothetical protein